MTVHQQTSGERLYDLNVDGVAHYGLYADWIRDLQILAGDDAGLLLDDMLRGPEAYLRMWENAVAHAGGPLPDGCVTPQDHLDREDLHGVDSENLSTVGRPSGRAGSPYEYCDRPDLAVEADSGPVGVRVEATFDP